MVDDSQEDGCWFWLGSRRGAGDVYGGYAKTTAHRYSWALHNGGWPEGELVVRHMCDTPLCVNPSHLELGTQAENVKDMIERGRGFWQGEACSMGHVWRDVGFYVNPSGKRECLACRTARNAKRRTARAKTKECEFCHNQVGVGNMSRHLRMHAKNPYREADG